MKQTAKIGSMSSLVFCFLKYKGYQGDEIGLNAPVCNQFRLFPSNTGMVLSKNANIQNVVNDISDYETLFEETDNTVLGESRSEWTKRTLVIDTDFNTLLSQTYPQRPMPINKFTGQTVKKIKLQLHQSKAEF